MPKRWGDATPATGITGDAGEKERLAKLERDTKNAERQKALERERQLAEQRRKQELEEYTRRVKKK